MSECQGCKEKQEHIDEHETILAMTDKFRETMGKELGILGIGGETCAPLAFIEAAVRDRVARVKELEAYVGVEMAMSDFRTAGDMRKALDAERRRVKEMEPVIKAVVDMRDIRLQGGLSWPPILGKQVLAFIDAAFACCKAVDDMQKA